MLSAVNGQYKLETRFKTFCISDNHKTVEDYKRFLFYFIKVKLCMLNYKLNHMAFSVTEEACNDQQAALKQQLIVVSTACQMVELNRVYTQNNLLHKYSSFFLNLHNVNK